MMPRVCYMAFSNLLVFEVFQVLVVRRFDRQCCGEALQLCNSTRSSGCALCIWFYCVGVAEVIGCVEGTATNENDFAFVVVFACCCKAEEKEEGERMATRDLTRRFAELRVLRHGVVGETKRAGDSFSESGLLDVSRFVPVHPCYCCCSPVFGSGVSSWNMEREHSACRAVCDQI